MPSKSKKKKLLNAVILESDSKELQAYLRDFVQELTAEINDAAPDHSEEIFSTLIAELALSAADQRRCAERRKRQQECVAAAQARGVRFGRKNKTLPDDFDAYCQAWRDGELSLRAAAESCGMSRATFQRAAMRQEHGCSAP